VRCFESGFQPEPGWRNWQTQRTQNPFCENTQHSATKRTNPHLASKSPLLAGTDAASAGWFPIAALPALAFDHRTIVDYAVNRLRNKLGYTTVGFELLPGKFTLTALQMLHEAILGRALDKRNFRRKILSSGLLAASNEMEITGRKPARLYAFWNPR
jgi:hypothetical protein